MELLAAIQVGEAHKRPEKHQPYENIILKEKTKEFRVLDQNPIEQIDRRVPDVITKRDRQKMHNRDSSEQTQFNIELK